MIQIKISRAPHSPIDTHAGTWPRALRAVRRGRGTPSSPRNGLRRGRGTARATFRAAGVLAAAMLLATAAPANAQDRAQPRLPTVEIRAGMHRIVAELATTPWQQAMGLMFRRDLGPNEGMLFVYDSPRTMCFWMRDTPLPLTIAFIADDGRILQTADMQPFDDTTRHCSDIEARYALEMHQGWFRQRGIAPGFKLRGAPFEP